MQPIKTQHVFICPFIICAICAVLLFLTPLSAAAQIVSIPDANLRAAIAEALGTAQDAQITRDEMATLTRLEAHSANISDLAGLEFAIALEEIRCNNNLISDISPLAELIGLRVIELRENVMNDLAPVKKLLKLEWLIVPHNLITDLSPVEDLINLRGLDISHNVISDLSPLEDLTKLGWIWATENPFSDISPLEGLAGLRELYLIGNEISDISPLENLTGLTRLSLRDNQVVDVSPLASLNGLVWIELEDNEILDFSPLEAFPESVAIVKHNNPGFTRAAPKIEGPWLWMIVPTGRLPGSIAAASGRDFLSVASGQKTTEKQIATQGAMVGDTVGDKVWTLGSLSKRGGNNINALVNAIGLASGNIDHHVAYGSVNLESSREQSTKMFVGSGDAVKVWLNGRLVHNNAVDRDAGDYQENFAVTLKQGTNTLLVAVYEGKGWWSGFFGFDAETEYTVWTQSPPIPLKPLSVADMDEDGFVNILDLILVARDFERNKPINPRTDINGDGKINILDLITVARSIDATDLAAPSVPVANNQISSAVIRAWITQAQIEDDGSLAFRQGIANLKRLLAALLPGWTDVFTNYPNPFNPETWIPYHLAKPTEVTVRIYDITGALVRTLALGHQTAGIYKEKSRAAYWDGKNKLGESVASGLYFYTLIAGDFTATRKMLVRK